MLFFVARAKVKEQFNEVFWNEKTGRFTGCIAKDGTSQDYGFTFVNLEAMASGIATLEHARKIFEWLDGERTVYGDTSKKEDIYHFKVAPRANTLAAEAVNPSFWDDWTMKVGPGTVGEYGTQIQNGGHIFYVSYYDLMSRLETLGITDAMTRMRVILDEFHKDQLRRKPGNASGRRARTRSSSECSWARTASASNCCIQVIAAPRPMTSRIGGVPASNRCGRPV